MRLTVIVNKLNTRKSIPADFSDRASIAGIVNKGFSFEGIPVDQVPNPALGKWYQDRDGYFYWGGGLSVSGPVDLPVSLPDAVAFVRSDTNWWQTVLKLEDIWTIYKEKGVNSKIAILDSGYNIANDEIKAAVKEENVFINTPSGINDVVGHGSHCAALVGGRNRINVVGCAPESSLFIAKITERGVFRNYATLISAIEWAIEKNVDIISISYGGTMKDAALEAAIDKAAGKNIVVIASIGDNRPPEGQSGGCYPALVKSCIAVGATDHFNQMSLITMQNAKTEMYAPGEGIFSYALTDVPEPLNGTSQSTAIVAGIVALMISYMKGNNKAYSPASIKELLARHADDMDGDPSKKIISPTKLFAAIKP